LAIPTGLGDRPVAGRTDPWLLARAAASHGITSDDPALRKFHDTYLKHLKREIHRPGPRKGVLPGVRELLDALSARDDVSLALLTGNFEESARVKLEYFDLWRYFSCGAFGDDAEDRNSLLATAIARVKTSGGSAFHPSDIVIVGDTPLDVAVALAGGTRSLAVATGSYDRETLQASGADAALQDFSDLDAVLKVLEL
jgi:phosphoglycolate phosphatase